MLFRVSIVLMDQHLDEVHLDFALLMHKNGCVFVYTFHMITFALNDKFELYKTDMYPHHVLHIQMKTGLTGACPHFDVGIHL